MGMTIQVGDRVVMTGDSPWRGYSGVVVGYEDTPFGSRPLIVLDNGMRTLAMRDEHVQLAAVRSEAQGEERASKYGALLAFADAISDAVWGGECAWEQDGGLERLSQNVRRWAKERAARRGEGGGAWRTGGWRPVGGGTSSAGLERCTGAR